jgi:hypothetical protein
LSASSNRQPPDDILLIYMQLLRRLGWLREDQQVQRNYLFLKQRQQQQLDLLSPLLAQGNSALLDLPIERLIKAP